MPTLPEANSLSPRFSCLCANAGAAARLTLAGEVDLASVPQFEAVLSRVRARHALVIVDLRPLEFMDCSGVRVLLTADRSIRRAGGRMVVIRGAAVVDRVLQLTGAADQLGLVDFDSGRPVLESA